MKTKSVIIIMALLAAALGSGVLAYSWSQEQSAVSTFRTSGYVLADEPQAESKQVLFQGGAAWRKNLDDKIAFEDVQGNQAEVRAESFAHYDDASLSAFSDGVVVDLNDVETAQLTNHYALSPQITFERADGGYSLGNTASDLAFSDFLWKVSEDKYMLVSSMMNVHFSDGDERQAEDYLEVSYIDEGVVQLQTAENVWQTISGDCYATLANGEVVHFSLRNVQNAEGKVLMDFSKIVLDAESNIEITPLTEELKNVKESVIPHFDITAEPGQAGQPGQAGVSGESGGDGEDGYAGDAGNNGAAGTSGTNGAAGSSGAAGANGAAGTGTEVPGTVLHFPVFTLEDWTVSATACSGKILVEDEGKMLQSNMEGLSSRVYLVDMETSTVKAYAEGNYDFDTLQADGYAFSFEGLEPDHAYRLVVSAPINTGLDNAETYVRDFISKTFWTDSSGLYMEAGSRTVSSVNLTVYKQDYAASDITGATVRLYTSLSGASAATPSALLQEKAVAFGSGGSAACAFSGLSSNTTYYARLTAVVNGGTITPDQILALTTLKAKATVGAPSLTANRDSWGFDVAPGAVYDPDGGITGYTYEFYREGDVHGGVLAGGASPVRTVTASSNRGLTVPLDGAKLQAGQNYYVRTVASFNDNEKTSRIVSGFSNLCQVTGSKLPLVYFVNSADASTGDGGEAADTSGWYDQLYGEIVAAPGVDGARVLLDADHHPTVTIRAAGYYYVQYPVYLRDDAPADGSAYLTGEVKTGGYLHIDLPNKAVSAAAVSPGNAVNGLRPATQYRVLLKGDLSNDGVHAYETGVSVGSCVVQTPKTAPVAAVWMDDDSLSPDSGFAATLHLAASDASEAAAHQRQMTTLTALTLTLTAGSSSNPGRDLGTLQVTESTYKSMAKQLGEKAAEAGSLGELMSESGVTLTAASFGLNASDITVPAVHITISQVSDYTILQENRINQKAYASNGDEAPAPSTSDGAVYVNEYKIVGSEGASHDIQLSAATDPLPEPGAGLSVTANDKNGDGVYESYSMSANYLNSGKLAKTITFYAFDYPDYHKSYAASDGWSIDPAAYPGVGQLTAVTAKRADGTTPCLGSVTIVIPPSGVMPKVRFVPQTSAEYYGDGTVYIPGESMVDGEYLFFYKDGSAEAMTGHQFVFAWTLTYVPEGAAATAIYPFARSDYDPVSGLPPYSAPQDAPRRLPTVTALPWDSAQDGATWKLWVRDPDGALADNALYRRTAAVSATAIPGAQFTPQSGDPADLAAFDSVTVPNGAAGSVPVSLRVQRYTDKYTKSGTGLFTEGNVGYTDATCLYSKEHQSVSGGGYLIPYYSNAFVFYHDPADFRDALDVTGVTVTLEERRVAGETMGAVNGYVVTVEGPSSVLEQAASIRMTFSGAGAVVTTDKYLEGVDNRTVSRTEDGMTTTVTFEISLSGELSALAKQNGVSVTAQVLFEQGPEGFFYADGARTAAVRAYGSISSIPAGLVVSPAGWYQFDAYGAPALNTTTDLPRMGSFFNLELEDLSALLFTSTRNTSTSTWQNRQTLDAGLARGAVLSNGLAAAPRLLGESVAIPAGSLNIPVVTPVIAYSDRTATANSISSTFAATAGLDHRGLWFLLQRERDGAWVIQRQAGSGGWMDDDTGATYDHPTETVLTQFGSGTLLYNGLDANTRYRVTAYYRDDQGAFKRLNMFNSSNQEVVNYLILLTQEEPEAALTVRYDAASYARKDVRIGIDIRQALNYYYTLELQQQGGDGAWDLLTYLDMGTSESPALTRTSVYNAGSAVDTSGTSPGVYYRGAVMKREFDAENHILTEGTDRIYLNYGQEYRVQLRVYNNGKGPAYGGSADDSLIGSDAGLARTTRTFQVKDTEDAVNAVGVYGMPGNVPTITFTVSHIRQAALLRGDMFAAVIVRDRADESGAVVRTDVSGAFRSATGAAGSDVLSLGSVRSLYLDDPDQMQQGDVFTCYLYAIQDDPAQTSTSGEGAPNRDDILQGRALEDGLPLNTSSVPVSRGESLLLATASATYTTTQTSAGQVSVSFDRERGNFEVLLANPVNQAYITHMIWSVTATYEVDGGDGGSDSDGSGTTGSGALQWEPVTMTSAATNTYKITLSPSFHNIPADAVVTSYTVTIQFSQYREDGDDDPIYDTAAIYMEAGSSNGKVGEANGGLRLTEVLVIDSEAEAAVPALLPEVPNLLPEEPPLPEETPGIPGEGEVLPPDAPGDTPGEAVPPDTETPGETPPPDTPGGTPGETPPPDTPGGTPGETPSPDTSGGTPGETTPPDASGGTPGETTPPDTSGGTPGETPSPDTSGGTPGETPSTDASGGTPGETPSPDASGGTPGETPSPDVSGGTSGETPSPDASGGTSGTTE